MEKRVLKNNKFGVVITFWEPKIEVPNTILKCINSLKDQRYQNWKCIVINDQANIRTRQQLEVAINGDSRFTVIYNEDRKGGTENRIIGNRIISNNDDETIIVEMDGDDYFSDNCVLEYLNEVYQDDFIWATYGQYELINSQLKGPCSESNKLYYRLDAWNERIISALRSYKYFLFKKILDSDMRDKHGNYYKTTTDMAFCYPMYEMAGKHLKFISRILYVYNNVTNYNDYKVRPDIQIAVGNELRIKKAYTLLQDKNDYPFRKLSIRLRDKNFENSFVAYNINEPLYIEWYRGNEFRDITVYTDKCFSEKKDPNSINIAWLLEPYDIDKESFQYILSNYSEFDYVLTYDKVILDNVPNSYFIPTGVTWIPRDKIGIFNKTKKVCLMASDKLDTDGHRMRHELISNYSNIIGDIYGITGKKFESRYNIIKDYKFIIEIQNCKRDFYFTERLIDCFLCGAIPIYYGCPSINKFFNMDGIITFNNIEELQNILLNLTDNDYSKRESAIKENYELAHKYIIPEDYMYIHFFRNLISGNYLS